MSFLQVSDGVRRIGHNLVGAKERKNVDIDARVKDMRTVTVSLAVPFDPVLREKIMPGAKVIEIVPPAPKPEPEPTVRDANATKREIILAWLRQQDGEKSTVEIASNSELARLLGGAMTVTVAGRHLTELKRRGVVRGERRVERKVRRAFWMAFR